MATIIRKENAHELQAGRAVRRESFNFADMEGRAGEYLETVRQEAGKIVQEAHRDAERIRKQAEVAGRKAAESAIERILDEKVAKRMETLLPALEKVIVQVNDAKGELLRQWERSALQVITAISARVIHRELKREPTIVLDLVAEALRLATGSTDVTLHINPSDYEHMGSQIEQLSKALCRLAPSQIMADPAISAGGCRIETKFGVIDQQIEAQLRRIEEDLE
jgi:flagellar biosynthesis/type III secretory pathway protein FliH